jgi:hypothetical protein
VRAGCTTAFQPPGSFWSDLMLASMAALASPGSSTAGTKVSPCRWMSRLLPAMPRSASSSAVGASVPVSTTSLDVACTTKPSAGSATTRCAEVMAAAGMATRIVSGAEMVYAASGGSETTTCVSLTRCTLPAPAESSAGCSTAFHPPGSSCSAVSPAKSTAEEPSSRPTPATQVSSVRLMVSWSPPPQHSEASAGCSMSRPLRVAEPLIGSTTKEGATTAWAELTAMGGMMTSMVSGAVISKEENCWTVMVTTVSVVRCTLACGMPARTTAFHPKLSDCIEVKPRMSWSEAPLPVSSSCPTPCVHVSPVSVITMR